MKKLCIVLMSIALFSFDNKAWCSQVKKPLTVDNFSGVTPLVQAIVNKNFNEMCSLLKSGTKINKQCLYKTGLLATRPIDLILKNIENTQERYEYLEEFLKYNPEKIDARSPYLKSSPLEYAKVYAKEHASDSYAQKIVQLLEQKLNKNNLISSTEAKKNSTQSITTSSQTSASSQVNTSSYTSASSSSQANVSSNSTPKPEENKQGWFSSLAKSVSNYLFGLSPQRENSSSLSISTDNSEELTEEKANQYIPTGRVRVKGVSSTQTPKTLMPSEKNTEEEIERQLAQMKPFGLPKPNPRIKETSTISSVNSSQNARNKSDISSSNTENKKDAEVFTQPITINSQVSASSQVNTSASASASASSQTSNYQEQKKNNEQMGNSVSNQSNNLGTYKSQQALIEQLFSAIRLGEVSTATRLLKKEKIDPNCTLGNEADGFTFTPLVCLLISASSATTETLNNFVAIAELLMQQGADLNKPYMANYQLRPSSLAFLGLSEDKKAIFSKILLKNNRTTTPKSENQIHDSKKNAKKLEQQKIQEQQAKEQKKKTEQQKEEALKLKKAKKKEAQLEREKQNRLKNLCKEIDAIRNEITSLSTQQSLSLQQQETSINTLIERINKVSKNSEELTQDHKDHLSSLGQKLVAMKSDLEKKKDEEEYSKRIKQEAIDQRNKELATCPDTAQALLSLPSQLPVQQSPQSDPKIKKLIANEPYNDIQQIMQSVTHDISQPVYQLPQHNTETFGQSQASPSLQSEPSIQPHEKDKALDTRQAKLENNIFPPILKVFFLQQNPLSLPAQQKDAIKTAIRKRLEKVQNIIQEPLDHYLSNKALEEYRNKLIIQFRNIHTSTEMNNVFRKFIAVTSDQIRNNIYAAYFKNGNLDSIKKLFEQYEKQDALLPVRAHKDPETGLNLLQVAYVNNQQNTLNHLAKEYQLELNEDEKKAALNWQKATKLSHQLLHEENSFLHYKEQANVLRSKIQEGLKYPQSQSWLKTQLIIVKALEIGIAGLGSYRSDSNLKEIAQQLHALKEQLKYFAQNSTAQNVANTYSLKSSNTDFKEEVNHKN